MALEKYAVAQTAEEAVAEGEASIDTLSGSAGSTRHNKNDAGVSGLRALDLFCGAGAASWGLYQAGYEVTGVDIKHQPRYPAFHCESYAKHFRFCRADALDFDCEGYDLIWASPLCQRFSIMSACRPGLRESYPDQIPAVRLRLQAAKALYVIENVPGAPLRSGSNFLCGQMFNLGVIRHRYFETNFLWLRPSHSRHTKTCICVVGRGGPGKGVKAWTLSEAREAMGIGWMSRSEIVQAIPPVYAEFIAKQIGGK